MKTLQRYLVGVLFTIFLWLFIIVPIYSKPSESNELSDLNPPAISYSPLLNTDVSGNRILTASITDADGVPVSGSGLPVLYWKINNGSYTGAQGVYISGNQYQFTFGSGAFTADVVSYYVVAQDGALPPNAGAYPSGGASGFTVNPPACTTPPTFPDSYYITYSPLHGDYSVSAALFNRITGKNVYFEKSIRRTTRKVFLEKSTISKELYREIPSDEVYYTPMENGKKYNGPLYVLKSEHPEYDYPASISGVYSSLTSAVADLNFRGVNGPTRLLLSATSYSAETFPLSVNIINDNVSTAVNTITIKPDVSVQPVISGSVSTAVFQIHNSYVIIDGSNTLNGTTRDLTISNTSVSFPQVISIISNGTNPLVNVGIKNSLIVNGVNTSSAITITDNNFSGGYFNNLTVQNNDIRSANYGIYLTAAASGTNGSGLVIANNTMTSTGINSIRLCGIYAEGVNGASISGNEIGNFETLTDGNDNGIQIGPGTKNTTVEKNKIYSLGYSGANNYGAQGIIVAASTAAANVTIKNNVIYDISGYGNDYTSSFLGYNPIGIYLYGTQDGINVYNNSINVFGANTVRRYNAMSIGICLGIGSKADIRNNVVVNNLGVEPSTLGYGSSAIYAETGSSQFTGLDFNDYYVNPAGTGVKAIGQLSATPYTVLSGWVTATGRDAYSLNGDPGFTSNTNLIPDPANSDSWVLSGNGIHTAGITDDFNGTSRPASVFDGAPDIGAYEFTASTGSSLPNSFTITPVTGVNNIYVYGRKFIQLYFSDLGSITSVDVKFYSGANPPGVGGYTGSSFMNAYYTITPAGGGSFVYDILYNYSEPQMGTILTENNIRLAKSENGGTNWAAYITPGTGTGEYELNTTSNTIKVYGLNTFSTFANSDASAPLPVRMESFTSDVTGRDIKLNWTTESEINNAGFEIQKQYLLSGNDYSSWEKTGYVKGNGTKSTATNYTFNDSRLETGKYKYRLKQIDYNGNFEYFNLAGVLEVGIPDKFLLSQNYPNPFNPSTKVDFQIPSDSRVTIKIYDISGREVKTLQNNLLKAGYYSVQFTPDNLSSGVYFYIMTTEKFTAIKKMVFVK